MNPDIVEKEVSIVVGIRSLWDLDPEIPGVVLREKVFPRWDEILPSPGSEKAVFVVFAPIPDDKDGRFEIVAGRLSDSLENIPSGMVGWEIPSGVYAVVKVEGIQNIYPAYQGNLGRWRPDAGYAPGDGLVVAHSLEVDRIGDPKSPWQVGIHLRSSADVNPFGAWG